jgi:hypothetical protein
MITEYLAASVSCQRRPSIEIKRPSMKERDLVVT